MSNEEELLGRVLGLHPSHSISVRRRWWGVTEWRASRQHILGSTVVAQGRVWGWSRSRARAAAGRAACEYEHAVFDVSLTEAVHVVAALQGPVRRLTDAMLDHDDYFPVLPPSTWDVPKEEVET